MQSCYYTKIQQLNTSKYFCIPGTREVFQTFCSRISNDGLYPPELFTHLASWDFVPWDSWERPILFLIWQSSWLVSPWSWTCHCRISPLGETCSKTSHSPASCWQNSAHWDRSPGWPGLGALHWRLPEDSHQPGGWWRSSDWTSLSLCRRPGSDWTRGGAGRWSKQTISTHVTESSVGLENTYKTQTSLQCSVGNLVIAMFILFSDSLKSIYVTLN